MRGKIAGLMVAGLLATFGTACGPTAASQLKPEAVESFDRYVQSANQNTFRWIDSLAEQDRVRADAKLKQGQVLVRRLETDNSADGIHSGGGLIHDWIGIIFIPGVSLTQTLRLVQDYDHAAQNYSPEVEGSRVLSRSGDNFRVFLRLKRTELLTTVFDTEYDIRYVTVDTKRAYSRSHSTRIVEVADPDTPHEHKKPVGEDNGFLWRLYSNWRFEQTDSGVYIQCEAISLTRDIPPGFAWMIHPFIRNIPDKSLTSALEESRKVQVPASRGASAFDKPQEPEEPLR